MADTATVAINSPGWIDYSSRDPAGARDFYSKLFGWQAEVIPDPQAGGYGMFTLDGKQVGGVGPTQNPQQPAAWMGYILVDDAKAIADKTRAAGGAVIVEPMDVMGTGMFAIIADPSGAALGLWQPGTQGGFEVSGKAGSYAWLELNSRDIEKAKAFYTQVFGWTEHTSESPGMVYTEFHLGDDSIAGGMAMPEKVPSEVPSHWLVYFAVDDVDAITKRGTEIGGAVVVEPMEFPGGRFSILRDPQGAVVGLLKLGESSRS